MQISSILSPSASSYTQNQTVKNTANTNSTTSNTTSQTDYANMTVSQMRDMTDSMAASGKLTAVQEVTLSNSGLMDPEVAGDTSGDSGYGYSRSDTATYNPLTIMDTAASLSAYMGDNQMAGVYSGISNAIQAYESQNQTATAPTTVLTA